jgi:hypothetical protein
MRPEQAALARFRERAFCAAPDGREASTLPTPGLLYLLRLQPGPAVGGAV